MKNIDDSIDRQRRIDSEHSKHLLDAFAALAMHALVRTRGVPDTAPAALGVARSAYMLAEAMLVERNRV